MCIHLFLTIKQAIIKSIEWNVALPIMPLAFQICWSHPQFISLVVVLQTYSLLFFLYDVHIMSLLFVLLLFVLGCKQNGFARLLYDSRRRSFNGAWNWGRPVCAVVVTLHWPCDTPMLIGSYTTREICLKDMRLMSILLPLFWNYIFLTMLYKI